MDDLDGLMEFAARTAERAGNITREFFGRVAVELKADGSEVTEADREAESYLRIAIRESYPADRILGEEEGEEGGAGHQTSGRRWIVDPIDGTRSFGSGVPLFGVLIALEAGGIPILGCCHLPVFGHTIVAATGAGAWLDGQSARVSHCDTLSDARVVTSGLEYWRDWATDDAQQGWDRLVRKCRFARTWGDCYGYFLVATGRADILADPAAGAAWDYMPMMPILHEAGGRFTTLSREPLSAWSTALATNGRLHDLAGDCWSTAGMDDRAFQKGPVLGWRE